MVLVKKKEMCLVQNYTNILLTIKHKHAYYFKFTDTQLPNTQDKKILIMDLTHNPFFTATPSQW